MVAARPAAARDSTDDYVSVPLEKLPIGARLQRPLYDDRPGQQVLLLSAGKQVVPSQIDSLRKRNISRILIHRKDWERLNEQQRSADERRLAPHQKRTITRAAPATSVGKVSAPQWSGWKLHPDSFLHTLQPPNEPARDPERVAAYQASYDQALKCATSLMNVLVRDRAMNTDSAIGVTDRHLAEVREDLDEFLHRAAAPIGSDYPSRHSLQTAMLATSMGVIMGFGRDELLELGCGCLLHDVGMLLVPPELLASPQRLSPNERLEVQKHPIHASNIIQHIHDVPQGARHVVYQMHERMNGSGYPRGKSGPQIHPMARIAAVADTYLALSSPRPFRAALAPYQAVERILFATKQGLFDPGVVRALLHTISLFPVGSHVRLSDGQLAQVVRCNREDYTRPTVQLWDPLTLAPGPLVDLREQRELIVTATAEPVLSVAPTFVAPAEKVLVMP